MTGTVTVANATITTLTATTANITTMLKIPSATVAAVGTIQGDAGLVATGFTLVSAADGDKGVRLPLAAAGMVCILKNNTAAELKVWPGVGDGINAVAVNSAFTMASLTSCTLVAYDATTWLTLPLVAS